MDDEPDNPHAMLFADAAFTTPKDYFSALLAQLQHNYEENAARLEERGARFAVPCPAITTRSTPGRAFVFTPRRSRRRCPIPWDR